MARQLRVEQSQNGGTALLLQSLLLWKHCERSFQIQSRLTQIPLIQHLSSLYGLVLPIRPWQDQTQHDVMKPCHIVTVLVAGKPAWQDARSVNGLAAV